MLLVCLWVDDMLAVFGMTHIFFKQFVAVHFGRVCFFDFRFAYLIFSVRYFLIIREFGLPVIEGRKIFELRALLRVKIDDSALVIGKFSGVSLIPCR